MKEPPELRIAVYGQPNTGKTTVARIIEEALLAYGFTTVEVQDGPPSPNKSPISDRVANTKKRRVLIEVNTLQKKVENGDDASP